MKNKVCPVCGKTQWNYDIMDGEHIFCGDCHLELRKTAERMGTRELTNGQMVFPNRKAYYKTLAETTRI